MGENDFLLCYFCTILIIDCAFGIVFVFRSDHHQHHNSMFKILIPLYKVENCKKMMVTLFCFQMWFSEMWNFRYHFIHALQLSFLFVHFLPLVLAYLISPLSLPFSATNYNHGIAIFI